MQCASTGHLHVNVHSANTCHLHTANTCHLHTGANTCVMPAHQTSDMSRSSISPESRSKLEICTKAETNDIFSVFTFLPLLHIILYNFANFCSITIIVFAL